MFVILKGSRCGYSITEVKQEIWVDQLDVLLSQFQHKLNDFFLQLRSLVFDSLVHVWAKDHLSALKRQQNALLLQHGRVWGQLSE